MSLISKLTELTNNNESFCSHVYAVLVLLGLLSVLNCNKVRYLNPTLMLSNANHVVQTKRRNIQI